MSEEVVRSFVNLDPPGGNVFVDLALTSLPMLGPEPGLVGRHRQRRAQLDHAVGPLADLDRMGDAVGRLPRLPVDPGGDDGVQNEAMTTARRGRS